MHNEMVSIHSGCARYFHISVDIIIASQSYSCLDLSSYTYSIHPTIRAISGWDKAAKPSNTSPSASHVQYHHLDHQPLNFVLQCSNLSHEVRRFVGGDRAADHSPADTTGTTQRHLGWHVDVRNTSVLTHDWQVRYDIYWRDVPSYEAYTAPQIESRYVTLLPNLHGQVLDVVGAYSVRVGRQ